MLTVFVASPKDESQQPKTLPDFESAVSRTIQVNLMERIVVQGAVWVNAEEIPSLQLRGEEPCIYINEKFCKGATVHPLSIFDE